MEDKNCVQGSLKCYLYHVFSSSLHDDLVKIKHLAFVVACDAP